MFVFTLEPSWPPREPTALLGDTFPPWYLCLVTELKAVEAANRRSNPPKLWPPVYLSFFKEISTGHFVTEMKN